MTKDEFIAGAKERGLKIYRDDTDYSGVKHDTGLYALGKYKAFGGYWSPKAGGVFRASRNWSAKGRELTELKVV